MDHCPSLEQLRAMLADDPDAGVVEAHATICPRCQEVLEQLAGPSADQDHRHPASPEPATERQVKQDDEAFFHKLQQAPPWTPPPPKAAADQRLPELPGYEVLGELGAGGMGVVYQARNLRLNRLVAIKMIHAGTRARPQDRLRFQIEAEAVAALQHPNIVQIHEVGEADGCPYLVLEYVEGGSLARRMREQPLAFRAAAELVRTLALAVEHAHRHGIIHRDLKPANVLLTADGPPKITDFGLAKRMGTDGGQTATGEVFGTPSYMAPEQARGDKQQIGTAADVYALGAILYDLLTGRPPFQAETPLATMLLVSNEEPKRPSQLGVKLPRDLETVCLKCLQKEPRQRYLSAEALAEDLRRFLEGEPIRAQVVGPLERAAKWVRRRPAAAALLVLSGIAALALVGVGVSQWENRRLAAAYGEVEQKRQRVERLERSVRYARDLQQAHQAWQDARLGLTLQLLNGWRDTDSRCWGWHHLWGLCHRHVSALRASEGEMFGNLTLSPDGRRLAVTSNNHGLIHVWDLERGEKQHTLSVGTNRVVGLAFAPDGRRLASAGWGGVVCLWDVAGGQEVRRLVGHKNLIQEVAFSPDGKYLASAGVEDKTVKLWDPESGEPVRSFDRHTAAVQCLAFSPDGRWIASGSSDQTVRVWEAASGQERHVLEGHAQRVNGVAFAPEGTLLASASADATVKLWDLATGELRATLTGHPESVSGVAFHADGRRLASAGGDSTVKLWDVKAAREIGTLRGHTSVVDSVVFCPDGRRLASASWDGTVKFWDLADTPQEARRLAGHTDRILHVVFSPDGRQLASASWDQTVRLWDVATGAPTRVLKGHRAQVNDVAYSPDGKRLASAGHNERIKFWDPATGEEVPAWDMGQLRVRAIAFSPDGRWLAGGGRLYDPEKQRWGRSEIRVWEAATGAEKHSLPGDENIPVSLAFSPDSRWLASASSGGTVKVWDTPTWRETHSFPMRPTARPQVAFSPDSTQLACASGQDGLVRLWDVATGRNIQDLHAHGAVAWGVAFSSDGRRLVSGGSDRTVKLWDPAHGLELLTLKGHSDTVWSVAFSPDDRWLASAGAELMPLSEQVRGDLRHVICLWDGRRGEGP